MTNKCCASIEIETESGMVFGEIPLGGTVSEKIRILKATDGTYKIVTVSYCKGKIVDIQLGGQLPMYEARETIDELIDTYIEELLKLKKKQILVEKDK